MTLVQLRHLIELARSGSFSQSASKLFITQPALSRSIKALDAVWLGHDGLSPQQPHAPESARFDAAVLRDVS